MARLISFRKDSNIWKIFLKIAMSIRINNNLNSNDFEEFGPHNANCQLTKSELGVVLLASLFPDRCKK